MMFLYCVNFLRVDGMTLIISVRCTDGFVIIADRKETEDNSFGNNVSKCLLSQNNDFFIALAGNGDLAQTIISKLNSQQITATQVMNEIRTIVEYFNRLSGQQSSRIVLDGFLVIKENNTFKLQRCRVLNESVNFQYDLDPISYIGYTDAKTFAKHFLEKYPLNRISCEEATKYVIVVMAELSKYMPQVGDLKYGYDITRFSNANMITQVNSYRNNVGKFKIVIDSSRRIFTNRSRR